MARPSAGGRGGGRGVGGQGKGGRSEGARREVDGRRRVRPAVLVLIAQMVQFHVIPTHRRVACVAFVPSRATAPSSPTLGSPFTFFLFLSPAPAPCADRADRAAAGTARRFIFPAAYAVPV